MAVGRFMWLCMLGQTSYSSSILPWQSGFFYGTCHTDLFHYFILDSDMGNVNNWTVINPLSSVSTEYNSLNSLVSEAFIRFFLETIGHYSLFIAQNERGERVFQREAFRKSVASKSIRRFLGVFMESQMFAGFIQDRELRKTRAKGRLSGVSMDFLPTVLLLFIVQQWSLCWYWHLVAESLFSCPPPLFLQVCLSRGWISIWRSYQTLSRVESTSSSKALVSCAADTRCCLQIPGVFDCLASLRLCCMNPKERSDKMNISCLTFFSLSKQSHSMSEMFFTKFQSPLILNPDCNS